MEKTKKEKAIAVLKSFETGDRRAIQEWVAGEYVPHYPTIPNGKYALLEFFDQLQQMEIKLNIVRAIEDGDFIILHSEYTAEFTGPLIVFDIFRFEDGKIVEHWSNSQEEIKETVSGHPMIDGPTEITDLDKTEVNKALLKKLVEDVFIGGDYDKMSSFFGDDHYIQHNPRFADGLSGLLKGLEEMAKQGKEMKFTKNSMILGEGNFVLAASVGEFGGEHVAFYDLFRVENGKMAEHWDVIETILPPDQWKNKNGKF